MSDESSKNVWHTDPIFGFFWPLLGKGNVEVWCQVSAANYLLGRLYLPNFLAISQTVAPPGQVEENCEQTYIGTD